MKKLSFALICLLLTASAFSKIGPRPRPPITFQTKSLYGIYKNSQPYLSKFEIDTDPFVHAEIRNETIDGEEVVHLQFGHLNGRPGYLCRVKEKYPVLVFEMYPEEAHGKITNIGGTIYPTVVDGRWVVTIQAYYSFTNGYGLMTYLFRHQN